MGAIRARHLRHVYPNGHVGLDDVGFTAEDGEFVALVGPSGSGKTTLLRTIAGFLRPERGGLSIGGRTVADAAAWVPPEARGLGMVFQDHAIWPHWSVRRNVAYPLKLAGVRRTEIEERVEAVLVKVGLPGTGSRDPSSLSGGQRQRVALARAIVGAPQALLLDEALSSLDEPLRARLRLELRALTREEGLTTIHVTHDRSEALALADRIVVMREGRIEQIGSAQDILHRPASAFVAAFMSDAALLDVGAADGGGIRLGSRGGFIEVADVRRVGTGPAALAAVLPSDIGVKQVAEGTADAGRVTSALFGVHGYDVSVQWNGTTLRAHVADWQPTAGDAVLPVIRKAHLFTAA